MPCRDYEEFVASLNSRSVEYLVGGAHALGYYARPRATKDLDIFYNPSPANVERLLAAIRDFFRGGDLGFTLADLTAPRAVIQLGVAPVRIDLISWPADAGDFGGAWRRRVKDVFGKVDAYYLSLSDLIATKKAAGHPQDKADLRVLDRAVKRKTKK